MTLRITDLGKHYGEVPVFEHVSLDSAVDALVHGHDMSAAACKDDPGGRQLYTIESTAQ